MEKKEYKTPELLLLGTLDEFTKNHWPGEDNDGVQPVDSPECHGS
jgi:hypothetical protein